jgi:hypothetical protein
LKDVLNLFSLDDFVVLPTISLYSLEAVAKIKSIRCLFGVVFNCLIMHRGL